MIEYLVSGRLPWKQEEWPKSIPAGIGLPSCKASTFPQYTNLLYCAMYERNPAEVLRWFDRYPEDDAQKNKRFGASVARAVSTYAPDRAVAIWKYLAERTMHSVKKTAHTLAGEYVKNVKKILIQEKREDEWKQYLAALRKKYRCKSSFLTVLNSLF